MKSFISLFLSLTLIISTAGIYASAEQASAGLHRISAESIAEKDGASNSPSNGRIINDSPSVAGDNAAQLMFSIYDGGTGKPDDPYLISNPSQLIYMSQSINSGTGVTDCFRLADDIDFSDNTITPIGFYTDAAKYQKCFQGVFDGNGHTIRNLTISSAETRYVGLFGFVYNGTIKNLTLENVSFDVGYSSYLYVGPLVGRFIIDGKNKAGIDNCHSEGTLNLVSKSNSVYSGGLVGYFMSGYSSEAYLSNSSARSTVISKSQSLNNGVYLYSGGLVGYCAATENSSMSVSTCSAGGNVYVSANYDGTENCFAGGLFGFIGTGSDNSRLNVNSCYANGNVTVSGPTASYAGGFSAYIGIIPGIGQINDCYATGNVTGFSSGTDADYHYACCGGFAGMIDAHYLGSTINRCYSAGNVTNSGSIYSYLGAFVGYNTTIDIENDTPPYVDKGVVLNNCYTVGSVQVNNPGILYDYKFTSITGDACSDTASYGGYDFTNIWQMGTDEGYAYPTLRQNAHIAKKCCVTYISVEKQYAFQSYDNGSHVTEPTGKPIRLSDESYDYEFLYWSKTPDGEAFDFSAFALDNDLTLYAVFKLTPHEYLITFINCDENFTEPYVLHYGDRISPPDFEPKKDSDLNYRYKFLYWSTDVEGTVKYDFSGSTVTNDVTLFAIYKAVSLDTWDGSSVSEFSFGAGTKSNPYRISNAYNLAFLAQQVNEGNNTYNSAYYRLTADIDLGSNEWTPIGTQAHPFAGVLDGSGYTISGYSVSSGRYSGLFGYVAGGSINALTIDNYDIDINYTGTDTVYASALCGYVDGARMQSDISRVSVKNGNIRAHSTSGTVSAGNIAGYVFCNPGKVYITNCYSIGDVEAISDTSSAYAGGISGTLYIGGAGAAILISKSYSLSNCTATAAKISYSAGISGYIHSNDSSYSDWYGEQEGQLYADNEQKDIMVSSCFATGDMAATGSQYVAAGYIIGNANSCADIENCYHSSSQNTVTTKNGTVVGTVSPGTAVSTLSLRSPSFLAENMGFDFEKTWIIDENASYVFPMLSISSIAKPHLSVSNIKYENNAVSADISVLAQAERCSVSFSVYNSRGKMVGYTRSFINGNEANSLSLTLSGITDAVKMKIVVTEASTLCPLFDFAKDF